MNNDTSLEVEDKKEEDRRNSELIVWWKQNLITQNRFKGRLKQIFTEDDYEKRKQNLLNSIQFTITVGNSSFKGRNIVVLTFN